MTLGYPRNDVIFGLKVKGQCHRVSKCIFHTNDYYTCLLLMHNTRLTHNSNMA